MKNKKAIVFLLLIWLISVKGYSNQPLTVNKTGDNYKVILTETMKELYSSTSAGKAIQFAIDQCSGNEGDITLSNGVFEVSNVIKLKSGIHLHGKRRGTELKMMGLSPVAIELSSVQNVEITELTITTGTNGNSFAGISIKNSADCTVKDNIITGMAVYGVYITGKNSNIKIERCTLVENQESHICLDNVSASKQSPVIISENTIFRGGYGARSINSNENSEGLNFIDNMCSFTRGPIFDSDFNSIVCVGNRSFYGEADVIRIKGKDFLVKGNTMCWDRGHSLVLDGAHNGIVVGNNFTDQGSRSRDGYLKCGIALYNSDSITISACSIWNWGDQGHIEYAIYEDKSCKNNTITNNAGYFHAHPDAFRLLGSNTTIADNTSNTGEYRPNFWDFTAKFDFQTQNYLKNFLNKDGYPLAIPDKTTPNIDGVKLIECKDQFEQVLTADSSKIMKFGWYGNDSQIWKIEKAKGGYMIKNVTQNKVMQFVEKNGIQSIGLSNYNNNDLPLWNFINVGNGYFKIVHLPSGKVLDAEGLNNYKWLKNDVDYLGQKVVLSDFSNKNSQMWRFIDPMPVYLVK